jgi:hypothetical protein
MRNGEAAEPQRVQQAEHRAVGADAERQRNDRRRGERRTPPKQAHAEPDVVPQRFETGAAADVLHLRLDRVDPAELQHCGPARLRRVHASCHVLVDEQFERAAQLVVQIAVDCIPMRQIAPHTVKPID